MIVMLGVSFAIISEIGCAAARPSIKSIWQQVPPVRWSSKGSDSSSTAAHTDPTSEPAVAANIAIKTESVVESESAADKSKSKQAKSPLLSRIESRIGQTESASPESAVVHEPGDKYESNSETLTDAKRSDSSMERLNAALTDDVLQAQNLPQRSLTALEDRLRVDKLLSKAKHLFDLGQLEQARQTAQTAQELGEIAQLDYSPDEVRPIDLVRRIDGELEAMRPNDQSRSKREMSASPAGQQEPDASDHASKSDKPSTTTGKDPSGLSRIRRDWSTLFRREKKAIETETEPAIQSSNAPQSAPKFEPSPRNPQVSRVSESRTRDAVVMANRSVSLGAPEAVTLSPVTFVSDDGDDTSTRSSPMRSEAAPRSADELDDAEFDRETMERRLRESTKSVIESDDSGNVPPDFDVVDSTVSFHDTRSILENRPRTEVIEADDETRGSDWTYLYIGFGLCSVLAFACYRRGAT
jgi:hypothetical protein